MDKTTHQIRCERWLKIINECLASGMKKSEWCKANGISDKSFYYWQRIDYYGAAKPPVRCGVSHLSGPTEPPDYYKLL